MNVQNAILSPDGYFALLDAFYMGQRALYILDLETLGYARVQLTEEMPPVHSTTDILTWTEEDQIIVMQQRECINGRLMVP